MLEEDFCQTYNLVTYKKAAEMFEKGASNKVVQAELDLGDHAILKMSIVYFAYRKNNLEKKENEFADFEIEL